MKKPVAIVRSPIIDYHEIIHYIEEKYKINVRDYSNLFQHQDKEGHFQKYQRLTGDVMPFNGRYPDVSGKQLGFENQWTIWRNNKRIEATKEEYDADFKLIHEHYQRYLKWSELNPENKPPEYLDYWHWMTEHHFHDVSNGTDTYWGLEDILDNDSPKWIKEITQLVYDEFKEQLDEDGGMEVYISW